VPHDHRSFIAVIVGLTLSWDLDQISQLAYPIAILDLEFPNAASRNAL
jgi:hypothetical protein